MVVFFIVLYRAFIGFSWNVTFFELFGISNKLGLVSDYKLLVGGTSSSEINSTRVNAAIVVARATNYKNSSLSDLGPFVVQYSRRDLATQRKLFGAIRAR